MYDRLLKLIAEGSSSRKKMDRALTSMMRKGDKAKASAKTPEKAAQEHDKFSAKMDPLIARAEYKKDDGEGRARGKMNVVKWAEAEGMNVKNVMADIPTGKNDSTQKAGRQLNKNRKGKPGARISGRIINRAQTAASTNYNRKAAMHKERETEKKRRERAGAERFERIKRNARWN